MTDGLVDKGIDDDERDDVPGAGRRRGRTALIGGGIVAALAVGGLAIAQPWAGDDHGSSGAGAQITIAVPDEQPVVPELSNRLALGELPEGYLPTWVSDGEAIDFFDGETVMASNVLLVGEDATYADGPWLGVTVQLLDKFDRKSFDHVDFVMASDGQKVLINGLEGLFAKSEFGGDTSELAFGPVNDGYVVVLLSIGLTQAEMVEVANEITLQESDDEAVAWPQFAGKVGDLGLQPLASYEQPSFGFGGGFGALTAIGGSSPTSTSVNYSSNDLGSIALSSDPVVAGLDTLAVARFVLSNTKDITVHDLPAVVGEFDVVFGGSVVIWEEGGRTMSVFATGDVDVVALAESVTELDEQAWADLAAEADANQDDDFSGEPSETWLIGAGELKDSTTWVVEGAVDENGTVTWCTAAMDNGSSMSGCNSSGAVEAPAIISVGTVGADGDVAPAYVATVPLDTLGAILRFTAGDGTVVETPIHEVRPDWPFLAAAIALTDVGTLEIVAADGTVVETAEIALDDLEVAFG